MSGYSGTAQNIEFPRGSQAQVIRASQRDAVYIAQVKEDLENIFRNWFGTRWLRHWANEVEILGQLVYYTLTTLSGRQTLGEEYVDIWQQSSGVQPGFLANKLRILLVVTSTLPLYALSRLRAQSSFTASRLSQFQDILQYLPHIIATASSLNLALFYLRGAYHTLSQRILCVHYITTIPPNPQSRPPSYALLGLFILMRLAYKGYVATSKALSEVQYQASLSEKAKGKLPESGTSRFPSRGRSQRNEEGEMYLDYRPVSMLLAQAQNSEDESGPERASNDVYTLLEVNSLAADVRASRRCTLCLEERTAPAVTECGHVFCWTCIVGWGREKPECPLCRQRLELKTLIPAYNL